MEGLLYRNRRRTTSGQGTAFAACGGSRRTDCDGLEVGTAIPARKRKRYSGPLTRMGREANPLPSDCLMGREGARVPTPKNSVAPRATAANGTPQASGNLP